MAYSRLRENDSNEVSGSDSDDGPPLTLFGTDFYHFFEDSDCNPIGKASVSSKVLRRREIKWHRMLDKCNNLNMRHNCAKLKERCYKGIPPMVRPEVWFYLCGGEISKKIMPHLYDDLIKQEGHRTHVENIKADLHLHFSRHTKFSENSRGRQELFEILKAYSILNQDVGYCKAQSSVAAVFLMHMPAEDAFRCFIFVCEKYLYSYYSQREKALFHDENTLIALLKKVSPKAYKHLKKQQIEPTVYMEEWFPYVYTRVLPWDTLLRVWDVFLYEGLQVLFKVALVLLRGCLGSSASRKNCPTPEKTLQLLKNPPQHVIEGDNLINQIKNLNLKDEDFPSFD